MKILMVGSAANVGPVLKRGLERLGHTVVLVHNPSVFDDTVETKKLKWGFPVKRYGDGFDVVHVHSPNLKKLLAVFPYWWHCVPLVCHWHGSDLRVWRKSFPVKRWFIRHAAMNLYSTLDLAWWIQGAPKRLLNCPVDTELFKPWAVPGSGMVTFNGGGRSFCDHRIPHKEMPEYLRRYSRADIHNSMGLDDGLFSVIAFEAAACGLDVAQFPWMTREWVMGSCGMDVIAEQMEEIYGGL